MDGPRKRHVSHLTTIDVIQCLDSIQKDRLQVPGRTLHEDTTPHRLLGHRLGDGTNHHRRRRGRRCDDARRMRRSLVHHPVLADFGGIDWRVDSPCLVPHLADLFAALSLDDQ